MTSADGSARRSDTIAGGGRRPAHRMAAHVLDAASDGDVVGTEGDGSGGGGDRGHRARTHAVDGVAGDGLGQAGQYGGGAADRRP